MCKRIITILLILSFPLAAFSQAEEDLQNEVQDDVELSDIQELDVDQERIELAQYIPSAWRPRREAEEEVEEGAEEEVEEGEVEEGEEGLEPDELEEAEFEEEELEDIEPLAEPPIVEDILEELEPEVPPPPGPKKITIDIVVSLSYQFFEPADAYKVKYHINLGGRINLAAATIRGKAEVATEVTGYLAKGPEGECILDVSIAKFPYEILFSQTEPDEAEISVDIEQDLIETHRANCTFIGEAAKPFITEGPEENWVNEALKNAEPPFSSLLAAIKEGEPATSTGEIPEYTVVEEDLGSAKIKGTIVITVEPITKRGKTPKPPGTASSPGDFKRPLNPRITPAGPSSQFRPPMQRRPSKIITRRRALPEK